MFVSVLLYGQIGIKNLSVSGSGTFMFKTSDFFYFIKPSHHAFGYADILLKYHFSDNLSIRYKIYLQETSYCEPYQYSHIIKPYLQAAYNNIFFNSVKLKTEIGDLDKITVGEGLTYQKYYTRGAALSAEYKQLFLDLKYLGTSYIYSSDAGLLSIGFADYLKINNIFLLYGNPSEVDKVRGTEYFLTASSKISIFNLFLLYLEYGQRLFGMKIGSVSYPYNLGLGNDAFLMGIKQGFKNNIYTLNINLETRWYNFLFNSEQNFFHDNDYNALEARDDGLNNWRNYFAFPYSVYGFYFRVFNNIKLIYHFYYNLHLEFLRLHYFVDFNRLSDSKFNFILYETGIEYKFTNKAKAFAGIGNKNFTPYSVFLYEISPPPYFLAYFKFKF